MASGKGKIRSTRKLCTWIVEQVNSGKYPGLVWDDEAKTMFRIPWKHAGKQDFSDEDMAFFKAWADYKGRSVQKSDWKTRMRCALNKSPEFSVVSDRSQRIPPYKVYRLVPLSEQGVPEKKKKKSVEETKRTQNVRPSESGGQDPLPFVQILHIKEEPVTPQLCVEDILPGREVRVETQCVPDILPVREVRVETQEPAQQISTMQTEGLSSSRKSHSSRKLCSWILEQVNSGKYPGLVWDDEAKTMFRIPWKNAHKQDFRSDEDAAFFKAWAEHKGNSDLAGAKHRMRCALSRSLEFSEVSGRSQRDSPDPYKVYRLVPLSEQDQSVESRLQVEMIAANSIKQEELEEHTHLGTSCNTSVNHQCFGDNLLTTHAIEEILHMAVCKEEDSSERERSPSLLQEEPEHPHIKKEQEEVLLRPEEPDGSMLTLLAKKSEDEEEDKEDDGEQDMSSHCSEVEVELESDTEVTEDSDDWEETSLDVDDERCSNSSNESGYLKTQPIHAGEKTFFCKHCNKSFINLGNLRRHQRIHTKSFYCTHCNKSFREPWSLTTHQRVHTGEKPFYCKHCNKSFSLSATLKTHQRIHTGEKPFLCEHCGKRFSDPSTLTKHQRLHTEKTPFNCKHCNTSFSDSSTQKRHQHIDTREKPFKCKYCDKSYTDSSALNRHQHVHFGEKHFQCKHCYKSFSESRNLKHHLHLHTGEKTFQCTHWEKSFGQANTLKRHQSIHTKDILQEEPEPPHIKDNQEELLQRPEEPIESVLTLPVVKSEDNEDVSSHCFEIEVELESDTEVSEDGDDWEETS